MIPSHGAIEISSGGWNPTQPQASLISAEDEAKDRTIRFHCRWLIAWFLEALR